MLIFTEDDKKGSQQCSRSAGAQFLQEFVDGGGEEGPEHHGHHPQGRHGNRAVVRAPNAIKLEVP